MSMKVTKVDGSVDEKNGLEHTVGAKSLGLLSTTIDKALGGMLKGEEALSRICGRSHHRSHFGARGRET